MNSSPGTWTAVLATRRVSRTYAAASVKATASSAVSGTRSFINSEKLRWGIGLCGERDPCRLEVRLIANESDPTGVSLVRSRLYRTAASEPAGATAELADVSTRSGERRPAH